MKAEAQFQDSYDISAEELAELGARLFSPDATAHELEHICTILAYAPGEAAQKLLRRFRESPRAWEVGWLDIARGEAPFHYLSPRNDQERREMLTLKVIEELNDRVEELESRLSDLDLARRKAAIELEAVEALAAAGSLSPEEAAAFRARPRALQEELDGAAREIQVKEAIIERLRDSISTPRYRSADPAVVRYLHVDV